MGTWNPITRCLYDGHVPKIGRESHVLYLTINRGRRCFSRWKAWRKAGGNLLEQLWVDKLLSREELAELDRVTQAQTVKDLRVFEEKKIEINYLFSEELRTLLENRKVQQEKQINDGTVV